MLYTALIAFGSIPSTILSQSYIDMIMGRDGYGYCLPNPLSQLPNISPYPYSIPDGFKFIISSPYSSGIPNPIPYPTQIRKIFFEKKLKI